MNINKRGLSDLVSNTLIILLVVVSIVIMGVIILNIVRLSSDSIESAALCNKVNVRPVQCIFNGSDANLLFSTEFDPEVEIVTVNTVLQLNDGETFNKSIIGSILGNYETNSIRQEIGDGAGLESKRFHTYTSVKNSDGDQATCVSGPIDCSLYSPGNIDIVNVSGAGCGNAGGTYSSSATSWASNVNFCSSGNLVGSRPIFPSLGQTVSWNCGGGIQCNATRQTKTSGGGGGGGDNPLPEPTIGLCNNDVLNGCSSGNMQNNETNTTDYYWTCEGSNGGKSDYCHMPIGSEINGSCGSVNSCSSPLPATNIYNDTTRYHWTCPGSNGGENKTCEAELPCPEPALSYSVITGGYNLSWQSKIGCYYQLRTSASLSGPWTNIGGVVVGSGNLHYNIVQSSGIIEFFRVFVVSKPADGTLLYDCRTLDSPGETYVLQNNIDNHVGTCFEITADNVILDGNGKYIDGDGSGEDIGIHLNGKYEDIRKNIVVKNFADIREFSTGISIIHVNSSNILGNNISNTSFNGVYIFGSYNNLLDNRISNCKSRGVYIEGGSYNILSNNVLSYNNNGILTSWSANTNTFSNNVLNYNVNGIYIQGGYSNNLSNNKVYNSTNGVYLSSSSDNKLSDNILCGSFNDIYCFNSNQNSFLNIIYDKVSGCSGIPASSGSCSIPGFILSIAGLLPGQAHGILPLDYYTPVKVIWNNPPGDELGFVVMAKYNQNYWTNIAELYGDYYEYSFTRSELEQYVGPISYSTNNGFVEIAVRVVYQDGSVSEPSNSVLFGLDR